ncbi:MAG: hypothetical protein NZL83_04260 [Candidatus Absconditabacterales bacterium]|nr:hypothetical protein [Candidatus Absconditabacterales bacterium]
MMVKRQVKDTFSLKSLYTPDAHIDPDHCQTIIDLSRTKYNHPLAQVKAEVQQNKQMLSPRLKRLQSRCCKKCIFATFSDVENALIMYLIQKIKQIHYISSIQN